MKNILFEGENNPTNVMSIEHRQSGTSQKTIAAISWILRANTFAWIVFANQEAANASKEVLQNLGFDDLEITPVSHLNKHEVYSYPHLFFSKEEWERINWHKNLGWKSIWKEKKPIAWVLKNKT